MTRDIHIGSTSGSIDGQSILVLRNDVGRPRIIFSFTITRGKIVEIDLVADPERLRHLDVAILDD